MPRMPGLQIADPQTLAGLSPTDRLGIARALGEMLAALHALTWPDAGQYDLATDTVLPFGISYEAWATAGIRRKLALARGYSARTTAADAAWVEGIIAQAQAAPDDSYPPCLVMNDYKEANTVVSRRSCAPGDWQVSGVFDLMEAHFGNGEMDLCRQVALYLEEERPELAAAFVDAYARRRPPRPGFVARFPLFMLRGRLIVWEYWQRPEHGGWPGDGTLRDWASRFVAVKDELGAFTSPHRRSQL